MNRPTRLRLLILVGFFLGLWFIASDSRAHAQDLPLVVEGDQVTYDQAAQIVEATGNVRLRYRGIRLSADRVVFELQREFLTAEGRVVLIDPSGRELRGASLRYDVRLSLAEMRQAETIVDRFYVRSEQLQHRPGMITGTDTMLTPCDPTRPAVRVTAQRIELVPGDRLVATQATLWVGGYRVFTVSRYVVSLRSGEETARSFPRFGYNSMDGLWAEYAYSYDLGDLRGTLVSKYGTRTGLIARNGLAYRIPPYTLDLVVGRNQDSEMRVYDQAELMVTRHEQPVGGLPVFATISLGGGWFDEPTTGVRTSRVRYSVGLRTPSVPVAPRTTFQGAGSWSEGFYGTGARHGIIRADLALRHELSRTEFLSLTYNVLEVSGQTPFLFDAIDPADLTNTTTFLYGRSGARALASTLFKSGVGYDFRSRSTLIILGYGERVPTRYHWSVTGEYNLGTRDTKLILDAGFAPGYGTYATVQAIYHTLTRTYEDLDFIVTSRLCDCVEVSLRYRHVRQEIWLEIGLAPSPQSRFLPQSQAP